MAPTLDELNNDGGSSYLRMTQSAFDQLRMNYVALHEKKLLTFVDPPTLEMGAIKTVPFGNVAWKHHLKGYLDLLLQNHELKLPLQTTVHEFLRQLPTSNLGFPRLMPEARSWFDCGLSENVLPHRLKTLHSLWAEEHIDDDQVAAMEERMLRAFIYN
jgi:hypothetical protein